MSLTFMGVELSTADISKENEVLGSEQTISRPFWALQ